MFNIVLYQPEIPPNTGNAMRLAANTGSHLHLIKPLGFDLSDAKLRRAGMDYRDIAVVHVHETVDAWLSATSPTRVFALAKRGPTTYTETKFLENDSLVFGPESVGLPAEIINADWITGVLHIPMVPGVRSLNLSNSVAVVVMEAWRQNGFRGSEVR